MATRAPDEPIRACVGPEPRRTEPVGERPGIAVGQLFSTYQRLHYARGGQEAIANLIIIADGQHGWLSFSDARRQIDR
jgi:hypothetical protein